MASPYTPPRNPPAARWGGGSFDRGPSRRRLKCPHPSIYALLFAADRTIHYMTEVSPALAVNDVVISERYMESTIAYQGALGLSIDWLISLHKYIPPDPI